MHDVQFGYWTRDSVREMMVFFSRAVVEMVDVGLRVVDHSGYHCFSVRQADGLCAIALADAEYPQRVAFTMLRGLLESFVRAHAATWRTVDADNACRLPELAPTLLEYQTPDKVDSIMKIHAALAETKDELVRARKP